MGDSEFEFSRPIEVSTISVNGIERAISANAAEREALARRLAVVSIESLTARTEVKRRAREAIEIRGDLSAIVVQACVVTLEPVKSVIETNFNRTYAKVRRNPKPAIDLDLETEEPDVIAGDHIDLGELVAEELALAIDPYPRAPGAEFNRSAES